jgi:GNAT superfamily N-acetyltransferase
MKQTILYNPKLHSHLIPSLVSIHMICITQPTYTIATFLPPLDQARIQSWWEERTKEVANGNRQIIIQIAPNPSTREEEVAGYVMLGMPFAQTGQFRGIGEKLLVAPEHRNKGMAKKLMAKLEEVARKEGRLLLVSDEFGPSKRVWLLIVV